MSREWLLTIQPKAEKFLLKLFEVTKGNPIYLVVFGEVIEGWGWTNDECSDVEDYLTGKDLIKRESLGSTRKASFSITRYGRRWAERELLKTHGPIEFNPPVGPLELISEQIFKGSPIKFWRVLEVLRNWFSHEIDVPLSVSLSGLHHDSDYLKVDIYTISPDRAQIGRLELLGKPDDTSVLRIYTREGFDAIVKKWWTPIHARMVRDGYISSEIETVIGDLDDEQYDENQNIEGKAETIESTDFSGRFPKSMKTRKKWAEIYYNVILPLRANYQALWDDLKRDDPHPDESEISDAIKAYNPRLSRGYKVIGWIEESGDLGMLEEYKPK